MSREYNPQREAAQIGGILLLCGGSLGLLTSGRNNYLHPWLIISVSVPSAATAVYLFLVVWCIFHKSNFLLRILHICWAIFMSGLISAALVYANEATGAQPVIYENVAVSDVQVRSGRNPGVTIDVPLHVSNNGTRQTEQHELDLSRSGRVGSDYDNLKQGDQVRIGLRRGGLGFTYIDSVETAWPQPPAAIRTP